MMQRSGVGIRSLAGLFLTVIVACAIGHAAEPVTVVDTQGQIHKSELQGWSSEGLRLAEWLPLERIISVDFGRNADRPPAAGALILFANGDVWNARPQQSADESLTVHWERYAAWPPTTVPLEAVSALVLNLPATQSSLRRLWLDLETRKEGADLVVLTTGERTRDQWLGVDPAFVELDRSGDALKLDRARVRAIGLDRDLISFPEITGLRLVFRLRDSSQVTARSAEMRDDTLVLQLAWSAELLVPLHEVVRCDVLGPRVVPVADRKPLSFRHTPYLSEAWPLVANRNVWHGPLRIAGRPLATGLGMHSQSLATYAIEPGDRELRGVVGLDDEAGEQGSVRFRILVDDREVWSSPEVTLTSGPVPIPPVQLAGSKQFSLAVDFGSNADVGDYANWGDLLILRDAD